MNISTNESSTLPTVSIVFPCRNRQDFLPLFLEHIYNLDYPRSNIDLIIRINDSQDSSEKILRNFQNTHQHEYRKINITKYDLNTPIYDNNRFKVIDAKYIQYRGMKKAIPNNQLEKVYQNLAKHRNALLLKADGDFIFSCDTDIMVKPDTLKVLLSHIDEEHQYISAHICNGYVVEKQHNKRAYDYTNALYYDEKTNTHIHYPYETTGLVECSFSGAVFLCSKQLYKNSMFNYDPMGEDFVFCDGIRKQGYKIWCDADHKLDHIMDDEMLEEYKNQIEARQIGENVI
jgi:glycosyltransferase involved in cell wall biosynthesis